MNLLGSKTIETERLVLKAPTMKETTQKTKNMLMLVYNTSYTMNQ